MSIALDDAATAAIDLIGRTGARQLEIGYLHDTPRSEDADWWAAAKYRGARVNVEHHTGPSPALEALAVRLLTGAQCTHCRGLITLTGDGAWFYPGATRPDGSVLTLGEVAAQPQCHWTRSGTRWNAGCRTAPANKPT
jgi:hypothetical protein